jgi:large subunit ribosomal protein L24e
MVIKTQLCAFSENRIYPGHGSMCCRRDGQTFWLGTKKAKSMYNQRKKPQKLAWTQAWRRLHKKNIDNRQKKKRTRRVQKFTRAVSGMDLAALRKRQTEKKSKRQSQQKLQLQEIKDRKKKAKAERKKSQGGGAKAKAIKGGRGKN